MTHEDNHWYQLGMRFKGMPKKESSEVTTLKASGLVGPRLMMAIRCLPSDKRIIYAATRQEINPEDFRVVDLESFTG